MTAVRTRMIEANGLRFAIDEAGEATSGDVALCLHGFPESRRSWEHQLPALAAAGWHAVAPDLRGYGDSSRPRDVGAYKIARLVDDVAALFDALSARRRLLIGHDWGAMVAWAAAIRPIQPLDGLIVLNVPHPAVFRHVLMASWEQRLRSWYIAFFQLPWLPEAVLTARHGAALARAFTKTSGPGTFAPALLDHYRANACAPGAMTAMVAYYRANAWDLMRGGQTTPRIATPTLMIWGEADTALSLRLTEGYRPYVADFALHRLPGVSHWVQQEAPDSVNRLMADWLASKGLTPGS